MESTLTTFLVLLLIGEGFGLHSVGETLLRQSGRVHVFNNIFNLVGYITCILMLCFLCYLTWKYHWYWILLGIALLPCVNILNGIAVSLGTFILSTKDRYERANILGNIFFQLSFIFYCIGYCCLFVLLTHAIR